MTRQISSGSLNTHQNIHGKKVHYPEFKLDTLQNIVYIPEQNVVLATFIDITKEEEQARLEYERKLSTIDLAQKVIHKQMMVAQEIGRVFSVRQRQRPKQL